MRDLSPGYFALVMATGILSTAADRYHLLLISRVLLAIAGLSFLVLVVLYLLRLRRWPAEVAADLAAPARSFGYFTVVAGSAVLGERLDELDAVAPALALLALGALAWLVLGYAIPATVMVRADKPGFAAAVDGSWLLWVVATQAISTAASLVSIHEAGLRAAAAALAVTTWAVGFVLYLSLLTVLLLRLLVLRLNPVDLTPPYWIVMGATAITVLAGARILRLDPGQRVVAAVAGVVEGLSLILWAFGTWSIPLLVLLGFWRHVRRGERLVYRPDLWALVFPLGMYAAASAEFGAVVGLDFMSWLGHLELWPALAAWLLVFVGMLLALGRVLRGRPGAAA